MARQSLRHRLAAHAHQLLASLRGPVVEDVSVRVVEGDVVVTVEVAPADPAATLYPTRYPGHWLSATEQLIWRVLEAGPLLGKQIASAMGWDYSTRLKVLLANLEERGVLTHDEVEGYARASSQPQAVPGVRNKSM